MRARALIAFVGATAVLAVLPNAGAATGPAVANEPDRAALTGVSTVPQIKTYLRSLGLDPAHAVIQRGARNYAGPNCPGANWNCTSASLKGTIVVQVSKAGQNVSVCDPEAEGEASLFTAPTDSCVIEQFSETGNNKATCRQSTDANPAVLICDVTQFNESGNNHADIDQRVRQTTGAAQMADVVASLDQQNESGNNHANLSQAISQSTRAAGSQSQDAEFDADVTQNTDSGGDNFLQQSQTLDQDGRSSSSANQSQSADHFGEVDQDALVGGEEAYYAVSTAQQSEPEDGFSKAHVIQSERQTLIGPGAQDQFGPMNCCSSQTGSPPQTQITIQQSSTQKASQFDEGAATQAQEINGECLTDGTCTIKHNVSNEADSRNEQVSGTGFQSLTTVCFAGSEGGFCSDGGD